MAKLTAIYGPVSSGKTTKLAEIVDRARKDRKRYLVCKSQMDTRTSRSLSSADGKLNGRIPAIALNSPWQITEHAMPGLKLLVVDEAQFFDLIDVVEVLKRLSDWRDLHIVIAGRDLDHYGKAYPVMSYLLPKADDPVWCVGVCAQCRDAAGFTFFKGTNCLRIVVVGNSLFEPRCERCFTAGLQEVAP